MTTKRYPCADGCSRDCAHDRNPRRETYRAAELFLDNRPNIWALMKRATPGAAHFNGEVMAHCKDEMTARMLARLLNEQARGASAVCADCESINTHSSFCPRYGEVL